MQPTPFSRSAPSQLECTLSEAQAHEASEQVEVGAGRPHDTETPDIETASDRYAFSRFGGAVGPWLLEQQSRLIDELLVHAGGERLRVLELGGGHAQVTPLLLARGHDVVVHGSAPACFQRIASLRRPYSEQLRVCVSNLWRLPFADREFDMVLAVRLLGHVVRWRELLREMARVSRHYLLIEFARANHPLVQALGGAIFSLKRHIESTTRPFFTYSEDAIASELNAHAFHRLASGAQFAMPMVLHRMLKSPALSAGIERSLRRFGAGERARSPVILLAERALSGDVAASRPDEGRGAAAL